MKKFNRIIQIFIVATILFSSIFQPINAYAMDEKEMETLINGAIECLWYSADTPLKVLVWDDQICYLDNTIWLHTSDYELPYYKANNQENPTKYEDLKEYMLNYCTPGMVIKILYDYPVYLNVNGDLYAKCVEGSLGENGLWYDELEIISSDEDNVFVAGKGYDIYGSFLFHEGIIGFEKTNDEWRVNYIKDGVKDFSNISQPKCSESLFKSYIGNVVMSFIVSENINCGYEKFSQESNWLGAIPAEIVIDSFDSESCTGKGHAILDEYDENGNVISQHKIVVEIGENLSEKVTDYDLSKDNPDTADMDFVFIAFAVVSGAALLFLLNKKYNRPYEKN